MDFTVFFCVLLGFIGLVLVLLGFTTCHLKIIWKYSLSEQFFSICVSLQLSFSLETKFDDRREFFLRTTVARQTRSNPLNPCKIQLNK